MKMPIISSIRVLVQGITLYLPPLLFDIMQKSTAWVEIQWKNLYIESDHQIFACLLAYRIPCTRVRHWHSTLNNTMLRPVPQPDVTTVACTIDSGRQIWLCGILFPESAYFQGMPLTKLKNISDALTKYHCIYRFAALCKPNGISNGPDDEDLRAEGGVNRCTLFVKCCV